MASRMVWRSVGTTGGKVWTLPLMAMVADRSGRSSRQTLRLVRPVWFWISRDTAKAVKTLRRLRGAGPRPDLWALLG